LVVHPSGGSSSLAAELQRCWDELQQVVHRASMSFVSVGDDSDFTLANIPFGIISTASNVGDSHVCGGSDADDVCKPAPRPATAIGEYAVDIAALLDAGLLNDVPDLNRESLRQVSGESWHSSGAQQADHVERIRSSVKLSTECDEV
jgi:hypothetical protein